MNNPFRNLTLVSLTSSKPGFMKTLSEQEIIDAGLNPKTHHGNRDLLDRTLLKKMNGFRSSVAKQIEQCSIINEIPTVRVVPQERLDEVLEIFGKAEKKWSEMAEEFIDAYPNLIADFASENPNEYDPENYPEVGKLRGKFKINLRMFKFDVPDEGIREISPALYEEQKRRFIRECDDLHHQVFNFIAETIRDRLKATVTEFDRNSDLAEEAIQKGNDINPLMKANVLKDVQKFLEDTYNGLYDGFLFNKGLKALVENELTPFVGKIQRDRVADDLLYQGEIIDNAEKILTKVQEIIEVGVEPLERSLEF